MTIRASSAAGRDPLARPLIELIPALSPQLDPPRHLQPYLDVLERARGGQLRQVIAAPPQHGKTQCLMAALVQWLGTCRLRHAYVTYNQDRADTVARAVYRMAEEAGLEPRGPTREWTVRSGGAVKFTSIGGSLTGHPIDGVLAIDDPIKDREEAESARMRQRAWDWLWDVAITRLHPGASVILMATRWHVDDPSGRTIKNGWPYLNLRAVSEGPETDPLRRPAGEVLWPERRPLEFLRERMSNAYSWASLYQGDPRPRGGAVFGEPCFYRELPVGAFQIAYGVDLAYTAKTSADWSVCVRLYRVGDVVYVADVQRKQVDAPSFLLTLKAMTAAERGPLLWYASGTEKGSAQFMRQKLPQLRVQTATADKFVRAQPVASAWNAGRVLVPSDAPWLEAFLDEVGNFTGVNDPHDDQIDALAAGFDLAMRARAESGDTVRPHDIPDLYSL